MADATVSLRTNACDKMSPVMHSAAAAAGAARLSHRCGTGFCPGAGERLPVLRGRISRIYLPVTAIEEAASGHGSAWAAWLQGSTGGELAKPRGVACMHRGYASHLAGHLTTSPNTVS